MTIASLIQPTPEWHEGCQLSEEALKCCPVDWYGQAALQICPERYKT